MAPVLVAKRELAPPGSVDDDGLRRRVWPLCDVGWVIVFHSNAAVGEAGEVVMCEVGSDG